MSYIGGQSAIDIVQVWKYGKQSWFTLKK
jgi:hypothetical protein